MVYNMQTGFCRAERIMMQRKNTQDTQSRPRKQDAQKTSDTRTPQDLFADNTDSVEESNGFRLWDEILKAIVAAMPEQLFPLFKEIYGKEYPKGTSIVVLGTEMSSAWEGRDIPPSSTLMDIALLVANRDYYHLECQMKNSREMVVRMFAYDVRYAVTHTKMQDRVTGEITLYFPRSLVIYPDKNSALPDHLRCRLVFQDGSEHIYQIPAVRVQTYSMQEIREKRLTVFLPYVLLRLKPKVRALTEKRAGMTEKMLEKELTSLTREVILILKEELEQGTIGEWEYGNYTALFRKAARRVLAKHPNLYREVERMTEPLIRLPSQIYKDTLKQHAAEMSDLERQNTNLERQNTDLERQNTDLERQNKENRAEIARLQALVDELSTGSAAQTPNLIR